MQPQLLLLFPHLAAGCFLGLAGGDTVGHSVIKKAAVDAAEYLTVIDLQMQLPSGVISEWHVHNHRTTAAPMKLQAWRPIGKYQFQLVCENAVTLGPGGQNIGVDGSCAVNAGDYAGWSFQTGAGMVSVDTASCDAGCTASTQNPKPDCRTNRCNTCTKDFGEPSKPKILSAFACI